MIATISIALAAGLASALMFASITSGAPISLLLINLAPLPLMVVGLAWGELGAAVGGIAAMLAIASLFGVPYSLAFVIANALPAWWLGHLVLLGRPIAKDATSATPDEALEWYPVGRILLWIVIFATIITAATLLTMGSDGPTIQSTIRKGLLDLMESAGLTLSDATMDALVMIAPIGAEIGAVVMLTLNLWLAEDCSHIRTIAAPVAGPEEYGAADDHHRRACSSHRPQFFGGPSGHRGSNTHRRLVDRLRHDRFRGAAHAYARHEKPRTVARLRLCHRRRLCLGAFGDRPSRPRRCRFRASPALPARQAATAPWIMTLN
jgi:hypothetical protein